MSNLQHTPGPWFVRGEPNMRCVVDRESAYIVDRFKLGGHSEEEKAANARLIAAAPDLLAACLMWDQGFREGDEFTPEQLLKWMNDNRRAARDAIARAIGSAADIGWCRACNSRCYVLHGTCRGCGHKADPLPAEQVKGGEG